MILLAVDTSSGQGSLALANEESRCDVMALPTEWKSTTLHVELSRLLASWGLKSCNLDGYAVANGPGTFTGLRIGLAAVKALAEVHRKPIITVSTLELLATAGMSLFPPRPASFVAALMDARRGQVFAALYRLDKQALELLIPDCVCLLASFLSRLRQQTQAAPIFCFTEPELFSGPLCAAGFDESTHRMVSPQLAGALAGIGIERLKRGLGVAADAAEANYVRASDAELFWKG